MSFALVEQHHVPHVSNFLSQCVPKGQTTTLLVSGILTHATQMYALSTPLLQSSTLSLLSFSE